MSPSVERDARNQFLLNSGIVAASLVLPSVAPLGMLGYSIYQSVHEGESPSKILPRTTFGILMTLPSLNAATTFSALFGRRVFGRFFDFLTLKPVAQASRLLMNPFVTTPLFFISLGASLVNVFDNTKKAVAGEVSITTSFYLVSSDAVLLFSSLLFIGLPPSSKIVHSVDPSDGTIRLTINSSGQEYGLRQKFEGMRIAGIKGPSMIANYRPEQRLRRQAMRLDQELQLELLSRTGVKEVVVRGSQYLGEATRQGGGAATALFSNHWYLPDFAIYRVAIQATGRDPMPFGKGDLFGIPHIARIASAKFGHRAARADRDFPLNVETMKAALADRYEDGVERVFFEVPPWTRTNKGTMRDRIGTIFSRDPKTGGLVSVDRAHGEDHAGKLWGHHWEPYARAILYAEKENVHYCVVPSVVRYRDRVGGGFRTVEVEFYPPVPVSPYIDLMRSQGYSLERVAKRFRDDQMQWQREALLGRDGYHTELTNDYYRFVRGKRGLGRIGHGT
ncbi:MAG: hypothetical protein HYW02_05930 [Deltaproteobacteria bacterium]|nr:hypothetical protein [Deltaproteobacteria bacterium]MBI2500993.1 hypothetical protein [Deltaproteobacteria bacterium]